jgi:serine/threonine protein kinase
MGIAFIHDAGIIHRDIKPENILVTPGGDVRISDFSCSYLHKQSPVSVHETYCTDIVGTWRYMAPEAIINDKLHPGNRMEYGPAVDYWALGCVFFELIQDDKGVSHGYQSIMRNC